MQLRHEFIRDRAYFIAGRHALFRPHDDPTVESAIRDAEYYIGGLPNDLAEPVISGATTVSMSNVLVLTWLVLLESEIKAVTITFLGDGICNVSWPESRNTDKVFQGITIKGLMSLDLPSVISNLRPAHKQSY
jgi:hypothetical protein